jgi:hypothetical protein
MEYSIYDYNKNDVISKTEHYIKKYAKNNDDNFIVSGFSANEISFPAINYLQRQVVPKFYALQSFFNLNENLHTITCTNITEKKMGTGSKIF